MISISNQASCRLRKRAIVPMVNNRLSLKLAKRLQIGLFIVLTCKVPSIKSFLGQAKARRLQMGSSPFFVAAPIAEEMSSAQEPSVPQRKLLVHWRGETDTGYSKPFRHLEFLGALEAECNLPSNTALSLSFSNALNYTGQAAMANVSIEHFNEAMQYLSIEPIPGIKIQREAVMKAAQRCSLVHALYEIIAVGKDLNELAPLAIKDGGFEDLYKGGANEDATWCFRARNYGDLAVSSSSYVGKEKRYGSRARSMQMEKDGLKALTDLLVRFGGKVNLLEPDCKIYIFDGLKGTDKVLARRIAAGPKTSSIAPNTRICVTNTPLEPIAAFSLCNVARVRNDFAVLDPYAGSCTTLLSTAMIAPKSQTVGIEIAHNGLVNRDDIQQDFLTRNLTPPNALIRGDSTDPDIRARARQAIGNSEFDVIIADPPYGIRESSNYNEKSPLEELFTSIALDRESGNRLLRKGGRIVAFVPVTCEETLGGQLPDEDLTKMAGLSFELSREQPLNEKLSRWLVSFKCER